MCQAALNDCAEGGTVVISGGIFRSGPLTVRGHGIHLVVESNSGLETAYGPDKWPHSGDTYVDMLVFDSCINCTLSGGGVLWGRGGRPPNGDDWYYLFDQNKLTYDRPHYLRIQVD